MRVLIISDAWHPQVNGVVRTYEHLSEELMVLGHDVRVIGPADFPLTMPMPGYPEIRLTLAPYRRLAKAADRFSPDYIHIATEGPLGWAGRRYCLRRGLSFTTCYHTQFPDYVSARVARFLPFLRDPSHALARRVVRHFHAPAHAMMVATRSLESTLKSWGFRTPMKRLTRGVNRDVFHPGEKNLFGDLTRPVALYVGRVAIEKNLEDFLSMDWAGSKVVVGDGPDLPLLKRKYPQAVFAGTRTGQDLADHYRSADVFVFPSRTDTFGMVLVEAMACGLPIAAHDVTGPKDIVTGPALGALDENLGRAAKRALETGTAQDRAEHAAALYSWEEAARQFIAAWGEGNAGPTDRA